MHLKKNSGPLLTKLEILFMLLVHLIYLISQIPSTLSLPQLHRMLITIHMNLISIFGPYSVLVLSMNEIVGTLIHTSHSKLGILLYLG